jgi:hypothetical protein
VSRLRHLSARREIPDRKRIAGHRRRGAVRSTVAGSAQSAPGRKEGRPAGKDDSRMEGLSDRWTDRLSLLTVVESRNGVENDR